MDPDVAAWLKGSLEDVRKEALDAVTTEQEIKPSPLTPSKDTEAATAIVAPTSHRTTASTNIQETETKKDPTDNSLSISFPSRTTAEPKAIQPKTKTDDLWLHEKGYESFDAFMTDFNWNPEDEFSCRKGRKYIKEAKKGEQRVWEFEKKRGWPEAMNGDGDLEKKKV